MSVPGPIQTLFDPAERRLHGVARESGRKLGAEEVIGPRCSKTRVAVIGVAGQCLGRGRMERDESGFAEFGLADGQDAVDEVDIVGREAAGLGETQAGRGQQGEVRDIGGGSQPVSGQQAACLLQERSHLRLGVDVGQWAARGRPRSPTGGTSVAGSKSARYRANCRTTASRRAACAGLLEREARAHWTASAIVTGPLCPIRSAWLAKSRSNPSAVSRSKPSPRRAVR